MTKIHGLAELEKAMREFPDKLSRNVMRGALRAGARVIQQEVKAQAPFKSGRLQASVRVSARLRNGQPTATVKAGGKLAWYAPMVEFGTAAHLIKPKHRASLLVAGILRETVNHPGAQPRPFMRPAIDAATPQAIVATVEYIRKRLTKAGIEAPEVVIEDAESDT